MIVPSVSTIRPRVPTPATLHVEVVAGVAADVDSTVVDAAEDVVVEATVVAVAVEALMTVVDPAADVEAARTVAVSATSRARR